MSTETLVGNLEHKFGSVVEKTTDNRQKEGKNNIKHSGGLKKGSDDLLFQVLGAHSEDGCLWQFWDLLLFVLFVCDRQPPSLL